MCRPRSTSLQIRCMIHGCYQIRAILGLSLVLRYMPCFCVAVSVPIPIPLHIPIPLPIGIPIHLYLYLYLYLHHTYTYTYIFTHTCIYTHVPYLNLFITVLVPVAVYVPWISSCSQSSILNLLSFTDTCHGIWVRPCT
jgi:hypothetical protein